MFLKSLYFPMPYAKHALGCQHSFGFQYKLLQPLNVNCINFYAKNDYGEDFYLDQFNFEILHSEQF